MLDYQPSKMGDQKAPEGHFGSWLTHRINENIVKEVTSLKYDIVDFSGVTKVESCTVSTCRKALCQTLV